MGRALHARIDKTLIAGDAFSRLVLVLVKLQLEAISAIVEAAVNPGDEITRKKP